MLLSLNIPTYNRGKFLKKNLNIIIKQIRELKILDDIEINISDNGSTDGTKKLIDNIKLSNSDIIINYVCSEKNQGPDINFIKTMHMAKGEYSILLGDDDFFVEEGLMRAITLIQENKEADLILSNRIEITEHGRIIRNHSFLDKKINSRTFNFSDLNEAKLYFSYCRDIGGCLTFISSLIYKTSILNELGEYNGCLNGTFYSFLFYFWGKLNRGGKLFYYNGSYILNTQTYNPNYGNGLERTIVDFAGILAISKILFKDKPYRQDFLDVPKHVKSISFLITEIICDKKIFKERLIPILRESNWSEREILDLVQLSSLRVNMHMLACHIFPSCFFVFLSNCKRLIKKLFIYEK